MKPAIVIPARYKSSRFEGKPLTPIKGRAMIEWVWMRCVSALSEDQVYVATDDDRIAAHCRDAGIAVVMTPTTCLTGTDRVYEASKQIDADLLINVQGDEPLIDPSDIEAVLAAAIKHPGDIINAMCPIADEADFRSPSVPKVVARPDSRLMYMSRAAIPTGKDFGFHGAMKQVCIYAFPIELLAAFASAGGKTPVEQVEDIEILRFLELGHQVRMIEVSSSSINVDFPEDVAQVEAAWRD